MNDTEAKLVEILGVDVNVLNSFKSHFEPTFPAVAGSTVVIASRVEPGVALVGYLCADSDAADFFENDSGSGGWLPCRSISQVEDALARAKFERKEALFVEKYEHGRVHYSVAGTGDYPDQQWDVGGAGVFIPCDDVQAKFRSATRKAKKAVKELDIASVSYDVDAASLLRAPREEMIVDSNKVLDSYSDWCNGDVYGVVVEPVRWNSEDQSFEQVGDEDSCWGYIGHEHATKSLAETMDAFYPADQGMAPDEGAKLGR